MLLKENRVHNLFIFLIFLKPLKYFKINNYVLKLHSLIKNNIIYQSLSILYYLRKIEYIIFLFSQYS